MTRTTPNPIDARISRDQSHANERRLAVYRTRQVRHALGLPTPLTLVQAGPQLTIVYARRWVVHAVVAALLLALGSIPFFIIRAVFSHSAH